MHKDLSDEWRRDTKFWARDLANRLTQDGQSLAKAREAWLAAFDKAAEERDSDGKA